MGHDTPAYYPLQLSPVVKSPVRQERFPGTTSLSSNPDRALTLKGEDMRAYVLDHKEKPITPCSSRKARLLLRDNKALVAKRTPFTTWWTVPTGSYAQLVTHSGLPAVS